LFAWLWPRSHGDAASVDDQAARGQKRLGREQRAVELFSWFMVNVTRMSSSVGTEQTALDELLHGNFKRETSFVRII
jgi:hypothetical protein